MLAHRSKVRGSQILAECLGTQRLNDLECCVKLRASFGKVTKVALRSRDIVKRQGFAEAISSSPVERQRLGVVIERLLLFGPLMIDSANIIERVGFPSTVLPTPVE